MPSGSAYADAAVGLGLLKHERHLSFPIGQPCSEHLGKHAPELARPLPLYAPGSMAPLQGKPARLRVCRVLVMFPIAKSRRLWAWSKL